MPSRDHRDLPTWTELYGTLPQVPVSPGAGTNVNSAQDILLRDRETAG